MQKNKEYPVKKNKLDKKENTRSVLIDFLILGKQNK